MDMADDGSPVRPSWVMYWHFCPIDQWLLLQYNWGLIAPEIELIAAVGLHCCIIFFDMPAGQSCRLVSRGCCMLCSDYCCDASLQTSILFDLSVYNIHECC
jgi:hypothetical protein